MLKFQESVDEQIGVFEELNKFLVKESEMWFDLFSTPHMALESAKNNKPNGPVHVGIYNIPSPAYDEVVNQISTIIKGD